MMQFLVTSVYVKGLPDGSAVKNLPAIQEPQEPQVFSLGWEGSLEESKATHSSILAMRISWPEEPGWATVLRGHKESDITEVTKHAHTCVHKS